MNNSKNESVTSENLSNGSGLVHFNHMPITYSLDINTSYGISSRPISNNDEYERERIRWAFELLENATDNLLQFKEVGLNNTADIYIYGVPEFSCYDENETYSGKEGFAGPNVDNETNQINNSTVVYCAPYYALVSDPYISGLTLEDIDLKNIGFSWKKDECDVFPMVELHEILHALGFDHTYSDSEDLMYPIDFKIQSCQGNKLDKKTLSCLKNIYSNGNEGTCDGIRLYPWEEEPASEIEDFTWESLPIKYSVSNCNNTQKLNLERAEGIFESNLNYNLFNLTKEVNQSNVVFTCMSPLSDVNLNLETDFWTTTNYFPAAQPYYYFDENKSIEKIEIILFGQNRKCGGIELHELLHAAGLRYHEGDWMYYEREVCSPNGLIDIQSLDLIRGLYGL